MSAAGDALRVIETGMLPARRNVATSAALFELRGAGEIRDTLRFHVYPPAVLVGRHQRIAEALDRGLCLRRNIEIARRITGGGAIFVTPAMLSFEFVLGGTYVSREDAARDLCEAVAAGLSRLGCDARYRAPNDIAVCGRKLCGGAGYTEGSTLLYQGMIMVAADFGLMREVLAIPAAQGSLADRLTSLARETGSEPTHRQIVDAVSDAVSDRLKRPLLRGTPTPRELALGDVLHAREYGTDAFVEAGELILEAAQ